jgi:iron complex transport system substrate-binding protein
MKKFTLSILILLLASALLFASGAKETQATGALISYTDDLDRTISIPESASSIAPSGNVSQMALYALAPETLAGWSSKLSTEAKALFLSEVSDKPVFGTFYGKKANLNKEALMASGAQFVLDVGDIKPSKEAMTENLDKLSSEIGMPVIFLYGALDDYPSLFEKMGKLLGKETEAKKLSEFAKEALEHGMEMQNDEKRRISVYYSVSDDGLEAVESGSSHSEVLDYVGVENVVPKTFSSANGLVSLESLYKWNPEAILLTSEAAYETVMSDKAWSVLDAVKNKRVYLLSANPYPLIDRPTSIQRLLGIYLIDALLYGNIDLAVEKTIEYYELFYHYSLDNDEAMSILGLK